MTDVDVVVEYRMASVELRVRALPAAGSAWRGIVRPGATFEVYGHAAGPGCKDWGLVARGSYLCLDRTSPGSSPPRHEWTYGANASGAVPVYASLDAWKRHERPVATMAEEHSYRFASREQTERGRVLVRPDGTVVPESGVKVYPQSEFQGRDLVADPVETGATLAWCVATKGCVWEDGTTTAFHDSFLLVEHQAPPSGTVRRWRETAPPEGVGDGSWVDIDVAEQVLTVYHGNTPIFVTLVSTGVGGVYATPKGTRRVIDKLRENDMASRQGAEDPYFVEGVPWVVHFRSRLAIHGTYWHDRFGLPRSHGCINLSPSDAQVVFGALEPSLPVGWHQVVATDDSPASWVRVR